MPQIQTNINMKKQANEMLAYYSIPSCLRKYGDLFVHGSYEMNVMVRPEIDYYLLSDRFTSNTVYACIKALNERVPAKTALVINQVDHEKSFNPVSGVLVEYKLMHKQREWTLDICFGEKDKFMPWIGKYNANLKKLFTPESHEDIMKIKTQATNSPLYKKSNFKLASASGSFSSNDIYIAVLDYKIRTYEQFVNYLSEKKGLDI